MSIKDCIYTPYIVQLQWIGVEKETGMEENYPTFKELEENLAYQIDYTANFNKSFRREFQAQKIAECCSPDEFTILYALHFNPNISQSELAKLLFKGKAHVGKMLNKMESRGLIKRVADTRNNIIIKRSIITPKGTNIFKMGHKEFLKIKEKIQENFSKEEMEQFINYLGKFRRIISTIVDVKLK